MQLTHLLIKVQIFWNYYFTFYRTDDLSKIPDVESFDVLVYLMQSCWWSSDRLTNYKKDNGYRLHMANHVDDVKAAYGLHPDFMYIKCTCMPETRQSAQPYDTWLLVRTSSGEIISGGCTCVAYVYTLIIYINPYKITQHWQYSILLNTSNVQ